MDRHLLTDKTGIQPGGEQRFQGVGVCGHFLIYTKFNENILSILM